MARKSRKPVDSTFIAWGDTRFGDRPRFGNADPRHAIQEQMRNLAGWPWPRSAEEERAGKAAEAVGAIDFVVHTGNRLAGTDDVDHELVLLNYARSHLPIRQLETLGPRDMAKASQAEFVQRFGGHCYAVISHGVYVVSLFVEHDAGGTPRVADGELAWLEQDAHETADAFPTLLLLHARLDRLANADAVLAAISPYRMAIAVSGDESGPAIYDAAGVKGLNVGSSCDAAAVGSEHRSMAVVHITDEVVKPAVWQWGSQD